MNQISTDGGLGDCGKGFEPQLGRGFLLSALSGRRPGLNQISAGGGRALNQISTGSGRALNQTRQEAGP